ncbi:hypothetical protein L7F22_013185 [Adiantum nelumboides]|nr:hypothetical protein [Adiantum nelumboides]
MDMFKVDTSMHWLHPTNLEKLQIFLGLSGFYCKYVRDYTKLAMPMTDQLKGKGKTLTWGEEQQRSFEKLKVALASAHILAIVDPTKPFVVETHASDRAIGAVLLQDGQPIAFESKKLDTTQQNYSVYERELYAIIHALKKWQHYLYGAQFEIVFEHESIKWFTKQTDLKGRKARWAKILQEYDARLRYLQCLDNDKFVAQEVKQLESVPVRAITRSSSVVIEELSEEPLVPSKSNPKAKVWEH